MFTGKLYMHFYMSPKNLWKYLTMGKNHNFFPFYHRSFVYKIWVYILLICYYNKCTNAFLRPSEMLNFASLYSDILGVHLIIIKMNICNNNENSHVYLKKLFKLCIILILLIFYITNVNEILSFLLLCFKSKIF